MEKINARILFQEELIDGVYKITRSKVAEFNPDFPKFFPNLLYNYYDSDLGNAAPSDWEQTSLRDILNEFGFVRTFANLNARIEFLFELTRIDEFSDDVCSLLEQIEMKFGVEKFKKTTRIVGGSW